MANAIPDPGLQAKSTLKHILYKVTCRWQVQGLRETQSSFVFIPKTTHVFGKISKSEVPIVLPLSILNEGYSVPSRQSEQGPNGSPAILLSQGNAGKKVDGDSQ